MLKNKQFKKRYDANLNIYLVNYMRRKCFEVRNNHKNILVIFNYLPNATYPTHSTPFLRQIIYFLSYNTLHIPHKHVA